MDDRCFGVDYRVAVQAGVVGVMAPAVPIDQLMDRVSYPGPYDGSSGLMDLMRQLRERPFSLDYRAMVRLIEKEARFFPIRGALLPSDVNADWQVGTCCHLRCLSDEVQQFLVSLTTDGQSTVVAVRAPNQPENSPYYWGQLFSDRGWSAIRACCYVYPPPLPSRDPEFLDSWPAMVRSWCEESGIYPPFDTDTAWNYVKQASELLCLDSYAEGASLLRHALRISRQHLVGMRPRSFHIEEGPQLR